MCHQQCCRHAFADNVANYDGKSISRQGDVVKIVTTDSLLWGIMIEELQFGIRWPSRGQQTPLNSSCSIQFLQLFMEASNFHRSGCEQTCADKDLQIIFMELTCPVSGIKLNHPHALAVCPNNRNAHNGMNVEVANAVGRHNLRIDRSITA